MGERMSWGTQERLLLNRKRELARRLGEIEEQLDRPGTPDDEDRATEREIDEVLEDLGLAGRRELEAIEAALARIAEGSYGTCARCGAEIAPERLAAVPTAAVCRDCAQLRKSSRGR